MNKTALIVDDSKSARFALRKSLEGFHYTVETAESASDAYRILGGTLPQVIFLDHIMPGIDGFEALQAIKSDPHTAAVPVVICSSNEGDDFIAQAKARGACNVLQKPPSQDHLASVLANLSSRRASQPGAPAAPLPMAMAPTVAPGRELTPMERLMATMPSKTIPAPQPLATPPLSSSPAQVTPVDVALSSKVQSLREPAVTIQQAVMKSIRDSMPLAQGSAPPTAAGQGLATMPAFPGSSDSAAGLLALREEMDERISRMRQDLVSELAALRAQLAGFSSSDVDDRSRAIATDTARAHSNALASSLEQHLSALRDNLDAVLCAQNERIEQLLHNSRQVAAEEAERTVMNAAQRISDQMAESILKTLGPQLSGMRRL